MKYIISEDRLENFIQKYLTMMIGDEMEYHQRYNERATSYFDKKGEKIFVTDVINGEYLLVDKKLYVKLTSLFSQDNFRHIERALVDWFNNHQNHVELDYDKMKHQIRIVDFDEE